jgi:hypothetical protein
VTIRRHLDRENAVFDGIQFLERLQNFWGFRLAHGGDQRWLQWV